VIIAKKTPFYKNNENAIIVDSLRNMDSNNIG